MLTPDRPESRLPVPTRRTDLVAVQDGQRDYSPQQRSQIERLTQQYLKGYGLPVSYQYFTQILPTIRTIIEDGLMTTKQSAEITPDDNIVKAFDKAAKKRQQTIARAQALLVERGHSNSYFGQYAVPADLYHAVRIELDPRKLPFKARVEQCANIAQLGEVRKPVFDKLLQFARRAAAEQIPGADQVVLDENQQVGLVRNLVFGWVTTGEPQVILETEEFILGKTNYQKQLTNPETPALDQLAQAAQVESPQAKAYLKDLAHQVREMLDQIPSGRAETLDFEDVDRSYYSLRSNFAVVDPFYKLNALSENPAAEGRTIWDPDLSIVVTVDDQHYRIPLPQTLKVLSYQHRPTNPNRFAEIREAINAVNQILNRSSKVAPGEEPEQVARQRRRVEDAEQELNTLGRLLERGEVPVDLRLNPFALERFANYQRATMRDELAFFGRTKRALAEVRRDAMALIKRHKGMPAIGDAAYVHFVATYTATRKEMMKVQNFTRDRLIKRIRSLEYLQLVRDPAAFDRFRKSSRYSLSEHFAAAMGMTVLDVMAIQSDIWKQEAIDRYGLSNNPQAQQRWESILATQRAQITADLFEIARKAIGGRRLAELLGDTPVGELLNIIHYPELQKVIQQNYGRIGSRINTLNRAEAHLASGEVPKLSLALGTIYSYSGRTLKDSLLADAARTWIPRSKVADEMDSIRTPLPSDRQVEALKRGIKVPFGPARFALRLLALLPDPDQLPKVALTLDELANGEDESFFRTRFNSSRELDLASEAVAVKKRLVEALPKGMKTPDDIIDPLLDTQFLRQIRRNVHFVGHLFAVEEQVRQWYDQQDQLLTAQLAQTHFIAAAPLVQAVVDAKEAVQREQQRLKTVESTYRLQLGNPIDRLQRAGLVRRVSGLES